MTTLYEVLDVPRDCDAERLKQAFRKAVKVNHPDLNAEDPGATARLRLIVRAKSVLSDPELRADYDRMLDFEQQPRRPFSMLVTTLDARRIVVLAVLLAGAFTLFTYISETPVARVQVTEDAAHEPGNVVDVRSPPPSDANAPDRSDGGEASVPSIVAAPTSNVAAVEDDAPALGVAPTATIVQEPAGVVDPPPLPSNASVHPISESLDGSAPSAVASSSAAVEGAASAPSVAPTVTKKVDAAIHSEGLTSSLPVKNARFYRDQGIAAYHDGDVALAITDFNLAIRLDPAFKKAYIDRGIALYRMGKFDRAFADIARAMRIENSR